MSGSIGDVDAKTTREIAFRLKRGYVDRDEAIALLKDAGLSESAAIREVESWLGVGDVGEKERRVRAARRGRRK